jgi:diadenylate cyclase
MNELFRIGFLPVTYFDILDIGIVAIIFYGLYRALKDTIAVQILFGLVILIALKFITEAINLKSINWILNSIVQVWLIAFIILFQPELRKLLLLITRSKLFQLFIKNKIRGTLNDIVEATFELSEKHTGAIIVFPRSQNVQMTIDTGISLQAVVTKELIMSIFTTKSPLHDGAVVIDNQIVIAARCVLPLSSETKHKGRNLGTRHRAALGLTEQVDAVALIVSEETGWISIADSGELLMKIEKESLQEELNKRLFENSK